MALSYQILQTLSKICKTLEIDRPRDGDFVTLDEQFQLKRFFGTIFKNTEMILVILQL